MDHEDQTRTRETSLTGTGRHSFVQSCLGDGGARNKGDLGSVLSSPGSLCASPEPSGAASGLLVLRERRERGERDREKHKETHDERQNGRETNT